MTDLWKALSERQIGIYRFEVQRYADGERPMVVVHRKGQPEPECVLTVNLPEHEIGEHEFFAKIDIYELTPIFAMLARDGIAMPTGRTVSAGYLTDYAEVWRLLDPAAADEEITPKLQAALKALGKPWLTIGFQWSLHPTEGVLVRRVFYPDLPNERHEDSWHRAQDENGDPIPLSSLHEQIEKSAQSGFKADDFKWVNLGELPCPDVEVGVTGTFDDTQGELDEGGIAVRFGGACPVQGDGAVDGQVLYYRSRGSGWSVTIGEDGPDEFYYAEDPYIWPDGGWVRSDVSYEKIRKAVAQWREWLKRPKCPACGSRETDNLGDGERLVCMRGEACGHVWQPGGES